MMEYTIDSINKMTVEQFMQIVHDYIFEIENGVITGFERRE